MACLTVKDAARRCAVPTGSLTASLSGHVPHRLNGQAGKAPAGPPLTGTSYATMLGVQTMPRLTIKPCWYIIDDQGPIRVHPRDFYAALQAWEADPDGVQLLQGTWVEIHPDKTTVRG